MTKKQFMINSRIIINQIIMILFHLKFTSNNIKIHSIVSNWNHKYLYHVYKLYIQIWKKKNNIMLEEQYIYIYEFLEIYIFIYICMSSESPSEISPVPYCRDVRRVSGWPWLVPPWCREMPACALYIVPEIPLPEIPLPEIPTPEIPLPEIPLPFLPMPSI